jgi:hypothetical protein
MVLRMKPAASASERFPFIARGLLGDICKIETGSVYPCPSAPVRVRRTDPCRASWPPYPLSFSEREEFPVTNEETIPLFRPVGQKELDLIRDSDWRRFPPRLPWQPIFYPVLSEDYAISIARNWNTKDANSGFVGYVLCFRVLKSFLGRYEPHEAGGMKHREYWIPAEDLGEFNNNLVGDIKVIHEFRTRQEVGIT